MSSVKKNFGYNLLLTLANYLFPLIVYPYISRVLGVEKIGVCNFVDSIVNFFVIFSQLGIGSYGVREVARCREDKKRLNKVFSNLWFINLMTFSVAVSALIVCTFTLDSLSSYKQFLLVGVFKLLFSLFLIEWLFQGIEQFRYITIRSVVVRLLYVVSVFLLVHSQEDALVYYTLTVLTIFFNAVLNWRYSRRFVRLSYHELSIGVFIVPILVFGYYRILTSMYVNFNVMFLGFTTDNVQVGYFSTATKLYSIILSVFTAFTTVMIPRVSFMLEKGQLSELQNTIDRIIPLLLALTIPVMVFCVFNASTIIFVIAGKGYEGAIYPFCIVMVLLLIVGLEQIVIQQFIMASKESKYVFIVSTSGAVIGVLCNIILTPKMGAIGSSISWAISEMCVLTIGVFILNRYFNIKIHLKSFFVAFLTVLPYLAVLFLIRSFVDNIWLRLVLSFLCISLSFILFNFYLFKNQDVVSISVAVLRKVGLKS